MQLAVSPQNGCLFVIVFPIKGEQQQVLMLKCKNWLQEEAHAQLCTKQLHDPTSKINTETIYAAISTHLL